MIILVIFVDFLIQEVRRQTMFVYKSVLISILFKLVSIVSMNTSIPSYLNSQVKGVLICNFYCIFLDGENFCFFYPLTGQSFNKFRKGGVLSPNRLLFELSGRIHNDTQYLSSQVRVS